MSQLLKTASARVNSEVNGLEGLNLNLDVPFKVEDAVVGFRVKLAQLKQLPDSLFAKKSFDVADGRATVDADFNVARKVLSVASQWTSDKLGLTVHADGDSENHVREVGVTSNRKIDGRDVRLAATYDIPSQNVEAKVKANADKVSGEVTYNSGNKNVDVAVEYVVDDKNTFSPKLNVQSKKVAYGWKRKWNGGSLDATYHHDDKTVVEWKDVGTLGDWKTTAEIPAGNAGNSKVTISRDWTY